MSIILVTGASGFVGSYALPELIDAGHSIVALVRDERAREKVLRRLAPAQREKVEFRTGDVTRPDSLPAAMLGVDAVLHLVAIPRDWDGGRSLARINTGGTRNVVDAAKAAGVRRFVHEGALAVQDRAELHYASSKARAERYVAESGLDWTILKPSLMWGPRDGFFNILAGLVRMSPVVVPVPGDGKARFQPLAATDMGRVFRLVFERPETIGKAFDLGGPTYWTYTEIVHEVARGLGTRRTAIPMPLPIIRLVAGLSELVRLPFPVATDQLRQLALDNIGPLDSVEREFGFAPRAMDGNLGYLRRKLRDQEPTAG
ncbi:MAG: hypothetical protein RL338_242 [Chloroflexota bacterium]|jgi:NADH dehydrogenase